MVIPDADVWIDFLNQRSGSEELARLVEERQALMVGPVISEILRGASESTERERSLRHIENLDYAEMSRRTWMLAGEIAAQLDSRGLRIPMTDVYIAALAIQEGHEVFTRAQHFQGITGLRLYQADGVSNA